jgi:hypothetical protein
LDAQPIKLLCAHGWLTRARTLKSGTQAVYLPTVPVPVARKLELVLGAQ